MAQFEKHFVQDLTQDIKIRQCGTIVFNGDNLSNVITVDLYNGTEPYSGGGSVSCSVICPDGATVPITNGSISGNTVTVTLTGDCFALPGQIGVGVQVVSGDIRTTILKAIYNVELLETDTIVDPGSRITASVGQLVSDIENAVAQIPASDMASLMAGIAPTFSASTNYAAGAYVYYNGTLYRFTADHAAGSWTGTDATAVAIGNDVADLKSAVNEHSNIITNNLMGIDVQDNLYPGSADWSGDWTQSVANSFTPDGTTIDGYPALKGTSAWRSIKKDIPVESGKTYTFQVWVKAASAGDLRIYLDSSTNPATTSPVSKQYTGTPNNTWRKLELTFSCTASGNVAPCIINANGGDFYLARYALVEGDTVFSLADEIDNNNQNISALYTGVNANKNTLEEYIYGVDSSFTLTPSSNHYTISYPFKTGMIFDISLTVSGTTSDSGQKNVQMLDDTGVVKTYYNSLTEKYHVARDATFIKFMLNSTGTWTGLNAVITVKRLGTFINGKYPSFTLYKDGTGDFTSLVDAINEAEKYNGSTLYIGPGTWNVLEELGDAYLAAVSESTCGLVLKNNIHVICSNQTVFTANYTGSNSNVRKYLSVFNAGPNGFTLENARIVSSNIRYCIHDDRGSASDAYFNHYINCNLYHDNSGNTVFGGWQCIGGGFGKNGTITIEHCVFDGLNQYTENTLGGIVSYHNSYSSGAKNKLIVKDSYFGHRTTVRISWYGSSTEISEAYIIGNNLGYAIDHSAENESATVQNTSVTEWNNVIRST